MQTVELSVVIPVYRSAASLKDLTDRLVAVLGRMGLSYEIVFVEDGSPDDSWEVLQALQRTHPARVVVIQLMRNYGQHNALMCGFRNARGAYVVTMDDDLQNPPEDVPRLYESIQANDLDLVYGAYDVKKHGKLRNLGSSLINCFYRRIFRTPVTVTSFRIIRRKLLESIFSYSLNFTFVDGLLAWNTQRIGQVLVVHQPRRAGRSGYSIGKLVLLGLNLFTNFSLLPLQMISVLGLLMAGAGFAAGLYYFCQLCLSNIAVPGYASMIIAIMVFGGMQMMALGIMGEYVGRLHLNVNRKPQYFVRQMAAPDDEAHHQAA